MTQSINVCFSTTDSLISKIVRWITRSEVSHCMITYRDETFDRVMVLEADWFGFSNVPWSVWKRKNTLLERHSIIKVDEQKTTISLSKLVDYLGSGYDYKGIISLSLRRFLKRFKNPFQSSSKLFCSESVVMFLEDFGVVSDDCSSYTPQDVLELVRNNEGFFKKEE